MLSLLEPIPASARSPHIVKKLALASFVAVAAIGAFAQPAAAQAQLACLGYDKLFMRSAQIRHAQGNIFNYIVRIDNNALLTLRFDVRFNMMGAQMSPALYETQILPSRIYREFIVGTGTDGTVSPSQVLASTRLTCR